MIDQEGYDNAKSIVEARLSFYIHLIVYICVNTLLVFINLNTAPEKIWFKWPMMGWGIGLIIHGIVVFIAPGLSGIKERMIENELKKQSKRRRK